MPSQTIGSLLFLTIVISTLSVADFIQHKSLFPIRYSVSAFDEFSKEYKDKNRLHYISAKTYLDNWSYFGYTVPKEVKAVFEALLKYRDGMERQKFLGKTFDFDNLFLKWLDLAVLWVDQNKTSVSEDFFSLQFRKIGERVLRMLIQKSEIEDLNPNEKQLFDSIVAAANTSESGPYNLSQIRKKDYTPDERDHTWKKAPVTQALTALDVESRNHPMPYIRIWNKYAELYAVVKIGGIAPHWKKVIGNLWSMREQIGKNQQSLRDPDDKEAVINLDASIADLHSRREQLTEETLKTSFQKIVPHLTEFLDQEYQQKQLDPERKIITSLRDILIDKG